MNNTILIFKSKSICYNSSTYFADIACDEFEELGFSIDICDLTLDFFESSKPANDYPQLCNYIGKSYDAIIETSNITDPTMDYNLKFQK